MCGNSYNLPLVWKSEGPLIDMYFHTDATTTRPGYSIIYNAVEKEEPARYEVSEWSEVSSIGKYLHYSAMKDFFLNTLLKQIKGTWSAPSLVCGHSRVQLLEDMHNCTSLKSVINRELAVANH